MEKFYINALSAESSSMKLVNKVVNYLEKSFNSGQKLGMAGLALLAVAGLSYSLYKATRPDITDSTVMITALSGGGGTGVVIASNDKESRILTNSHVCAVLKNGGLISNNKGKKHTATSYKMSAVHDLCLVTVEANLGIPAVISGSVPNMFDRARVSGHPRLLPNVVTEGHFSGHKIVNVLTGFKECTEEDMKNESLVLICGLFGKIPLITTYDTVLVTATIMPGSSGSAVYNSNNELSGVVFAGSGDLGYAFTVPYEYVIHFLLNEVPTLTEIYPNYQASILNAPGSKSSLKEDVSKFKAACENITETYPEVKRVCDVIKNDVIWDDQF